MQMVCVYFLSKVFSVFFVKFHVGWFTECIYWNQSQLEPILQKFFKFDKNLRTHSYAWKMLQLMSVTGQCFDPLLKGQQLLSQHYTWAITYWTLALTHLSWNVQPFIIVSVFNRPYLKQLLCEFLQPSI